MGALVVFFKIILKLVLLPLLLLKWIVMGVAALPLLPFLALGGLVWLLVRSNRRPAVA